MPAVGVETQFQLQCDNIAAYKKALVAAVSARSKIWPMVDLAQNQVYEDRVKGALITALDIRMDTTPYGANVGDWFSLHRDYFTIDLGFNNGIDDGIAAYGWRVHQYLNQFYIDFNGSGAGFTANNVFPREDFVMGTLVRTGDVFTAGTQVDTTQSGPGKIAARATVIIGGAIYTVTASLIRSDLTLEVLPVAFPAASPIGTTKIYGEQLLTANVLAGVPTVLVASTAGFTVGQQVLIEDVAPNAEWLTILSIVVNTSITFTTNLKNPYTMANTAKVTPLFFGVSAPTTGGVTGTAGDTVEFRVSPDRVVVI